MTVIQIEVSDDLLRDMNEFAKQSGRPIADVMQEALQQYRNGLKKPAGKHRLIDIPPGRSLGEILKPWNSRAEMLEDFFDDRD
jgi:hypothetical protein